MASERKLVRARPKAIEYLPEWAKCCVELVAQIAKTGDLIIDMSTLQLGSSGPCIFCGAIKEPTPWAMDNEGLWTELELLDLDEGELIERGA